MYRIMKTLKEVGFDGIVVPDHVPHFVNSQAGYGVGDAYVIGYIKALLQVVNTEIEHR